MYSSQALRSLRIKTHVRDRFVWVCCNMLKKSCLNISLNFLRLYLREEVYPKLLRLQSESPPSRSPNSPSISQNLRPDHGGGSDLGSGIVWQRKGSSRRAVRREEGWGEHMAATWRRASQKADQIYCPPSSFRGCWISKIVQIWKRIDSTESELLLVTACFLRADHSYGVHELWSGSPWPHLVSCRQDLLQNW